MVIGQLESSVKGCGTLQWWVLRRKGFSGIEVSPLTDCRDVTSRFFSGCLTQVSLFFVWLLAILISVNPCLIFDHFSLICLSISQYVLFVASFYITLLLSISRRIHVNSSNFGHIFWAILLVVKRRLVTIAFWVNYIINCCSKSKSYCLIRTYTCSIHFVFVAEICSYYWQIIYVYQYMSFNLFYWQVAQNIFEWCFSFIK